MYDTYVGRAAVAQQIVDEIKAMDKRAAQTAHGLELIKTWEMMLANDLRWDHTHAVEGGQAR